MVIATQHPHHTTIQEIGLEEDRTIQGNGEDKLDAYKLDLPTSMKIHNTFNISLLEPYEDNKFPSQIQKPTSPIQTAGEDEYELQTIIDSRFHYNKLQYRAKWTSYPPEHDKV